MAHLYEQKSAVSDRMGMENMKDNGVGWGLLNAHRCLQFAARKEERREMACFYKQFNDLVSCTWSTISVRTGDI